MAFIVIIKEVKEVPCTEAGNYTTVRQEYISPDRYDELDYKDRKEFKKIVEGEITQYIRNVYDYAPAILSTKLVDKEIYRQEVADLAVEEVIKSVLSAASPKIGQMIAVGKQRDS